jgi:hypothetical protein
MSGEDVSRYGRLALDSLQGNEPHGRVLPLHGFFTSITPWSHP